LRAPEFKARIAAIIGHKTEHIAGASRPHPMLVRRKRVIRTKKPVIKSVHEYEVRPRKAHRRVDLISDALPFDVIKEKGGRA
jgi:hypothetical protein